jgi:recombination endonuclease VII
MLVSQQGLCAICEKPMGDDPTTDHCHRTGRIRALLCRRCNGALGSMDDSNARLETAIAYLRRFEEANEAFSDDGEYIIGSGDRDDDSL